MTEPYHRDMTTAAVIFGGPSDEHDISILTGLQVARALPGDPPTFYWSKAGSGTGSIRKRKRQISWTGFPARRERSPSWRLPEVDSFRNEDRFQSTWP